MSSSANQSLKPLRIWPPIFLIALALILRSSPKLIKDAPDWLWIVAVFGPLVCGLIVLIWWFTCSRASGREKLLSLVGLALGVVILIVGLDSTMKGPGMMTLTIPMGILGFAATAILVSRWLDGKRILAIVAICVLSFAFSILLRNGGMWGNGAQDFRWRWTPTPEEAMLAARNAESADSIPQNTESVMSSGVPEWPGFRGPNRDGQQTGTTLSSDWKASPPRELWRIAVGPGWASFAAQGNRLFTQEQRGPDEFVVCYAADSGNELWTSPIGGRFDDPMGGPGPRATPELSNGRLYALSANGTLACVNAADGANLWKVDIAKIAEREPPMWGYASSPLVVDSLVIVHAGGAGDKGILAFDTASGELKWSASSGDHSYSSAQLSTLLGEEFVLMSTNLGLRLLDPETGNVRYFHDSKHSAYRTLQPQLLSSDAVLVQASGGPGTYRLNLTKSGDKISGEEGWNTTWLKSDFNGCVIHEDFLYGFNGSVMVCLDIKTGERKWRAGRYGKGQVLLLKDSGLLLVVSEQGQAILVRATPEKHEELASAQIFEGKAWSHPVVIGDRLYLRNAQEAVCFQLPTK